MRGNHHRSVDGMEIALLSSQGQGIPTQRYILTRSPDCPGADTVQLADQRPCLHAPEVSVVSEKEVGGIPAAFDRADGMSAAPDLRQMLAAVTNTIGTAPLDCSCRPRPALHHVFTTPAYRIDHGAKQPGRERRCKVWACAMAAHILAILIAAAALGPVAAAEEDGSVGVEKTGKERLTDKASDEQRTNDCKVPQARRTHARSTHCPWEPKS